VSQSSADHACVGGGDMKHTILFGWLTLALAGLTASETLSL
jgi:hypothetical protein